MKTVSSDPCKAMAQMPWPSPQYPPLQMPPPGLTTDGEYQMRYMLMSQIEQIQEFQHLLMHQMMQMTQMQQMQMVNQLQQPHLQSDKKANKTHKKDNRADFSKMMERPNPQVPPDGVDEFEAGKSVILGALNSLYEDQIMPHHMLVLRRIQEKYGHRWSGQQLSHMCSMIPEIQTVRDGKQNNILLQKPPEGFTEFVDQSAQDDTFGPDLWEEVEKFLRAEAQQGPAGAEEWPGSRYEFAKWIRGCLPSLDEYSSERVCHLDRFCDMGTF
eukprot:gnl/MRDRNA2_/MRDRNA2_80347_c0_seq2.p1 gnl/MRDRNA2_/MRDRNA2_80347_c0~~gnl/MRDRNA2_/MRDRNA2_80347_c0_seq2.p1  ORF type:complete len:270 (-),score=62.35 gnl/MRDRNA2_/MRDRNA2_80347_c0_seq2:41-850(-)